MKTRVINMILDILILLNWTQIYNEKNI